jgi:hypothetical protein
MIRYQNKTMQSDIFLLRYWTEMSEARMPMPALVLRMLMPTYGFNMCLNLSSFKNVALLGSSVGAGAGAGAA